MNMNLRSQDLFVLLKMAAGGPIAYGALAAELGMSPSEVHKSVKRAILAGLVGEMGPRSRRVNLQALLNFLIGGAARSFPVKPGPITRGIPTAQGAPPLNTRIRSGDDLLPVWPHNDGTTRGYAIEPLHKSVPVAAQRDARLYELLALFDALRIGGARERKAAVSELRSLLTRSEAFRESGFRQLAPTSASRGLQTESEPHWGERQALGITESHLQTWSDITGSDQILPDLVRRLVMGLVPRRDLISIQFHAHRASYLSGNDGELRTRTPTMFANTPRSLWQISTRKDIRRKASKDYEDTSKAVADSGEAQEATYVALTSRVWKNKQEWAQERRQRGEWADVRAYDAIDLAQWIGQCLPAQLWFSDLLGFPIKDLVTPRDFLEAWRRRTAPPLPIDFVLAGREHEVAEFWKRLEDGAACVWVQGDTREEALAFLCACLDSRGDQHGRFWLERTIIARTNDALQFASAQGAAEDDPLVLVPFFPKPELERVALSKHLIFVPSSSADSFLAPRSNIIALRALRIGTLANTLNVLLGDPTRAQELARKSGGKLAALQRLMGFNAPMPNWANNQSSALLPALLLAGAWDPRNERDREILQQLIGGGAYAELEAPIERFLHVEDAPLQTNGYTRAWRSRTDAFRLLARMLSPGLLRRYFDLCAEILGKTSPRYELPAEKRGFASWYGDVLPESEALRHGLAEGLAMLASLPDDIKDAMSPPSRAECENNIARVVRSVLVQDWQRWATIGACLPLLAEAHPDAFLDAVWDLLGSTEANRLFEQDRASDGPFGECCHAGLLWALEILAWHPQHFSRCAKILARLAERDPDPGGRFQNRPKETLFNLFHPVVRQTAYPNEDRIDVLHRLCADFPEVGWRLLCEILSAYPHDRPVSSTCRPRYQTWNLPAELDRYTPDECDAYRKVILSLALERLPTTADELAKLIEKQTLEVMMDDVRTFIRNELEPFKEGSEAGLLRLQTALRGWISFRFLHYEEAAAEREDVKDTYKLVEEMESPDLARRFAWLFSHNPVLAEASEWDQNRKVREERLRQQQQAAIRTLLEREGLPGVQRLAQIAAAPFLVGAALADRNDAADYDWAMIEIVEAADAGREDWVEAYIQRRVQEMGIEWLVQLCEARVTAGRPREAVRLACAVDSLPEIRDWAEKQNNALRDSYWKHARFWTPRIRDDDDFARCVNRLLRLDRWLEAIEMVRWTLHEAEPPGRASDYVKLLEYPSEDHRLQEICSRGDAWVVPYVIPNIFAHLDRIGRVRNETMARLEIAYFDLLKNSQRPASRVFQILGERSEEFVSLVEALYRPAASEPDHANIAEAEQSEREKRADVALRLLNGWGGFPGAGRPAPERDASLRQWCQVVLARLRDSDREEVGEIHVAHVLARVPEDEVDGIWPCRVAREFVEKGNRKIGDGLYTAKFNERGVVSRRLGEGGNQERQIAEGFRRDADRLRNGFPETAALLDRLANTFEHMARHEDMEHERFTDV